MKKYIRTLLLLVVIGWVGYQSIYIKKLDVVKLNAAAKFDAMAFSQKLWKETLPPRLDSAVALKGLIQSVNQQPELALEQYTHAMAIGNYRYALVACKGVVTKMNEDDWELTLEGGGTIKLATEFIYGNAIRDASNMLQLKDFPNTSDLNSISEALNKIVRMEVLPFFKKAVQVGNTLNIVGAIEINKAHLNWKELEVIPVRLQIQP